METALALKPIDLAAIKPLQSHKEAMVDLLIISVGNGAIKPEELLVKLKFLTEVFESVRSNLNEMVRREAELHNGSFKVLGATIEAAETGVSYDYTGDPVWGRLKYAANQTARLLKEREALLKTLKKPLTEVDNESGEVLHIPPPVKTSTSSIKIILGK